MKKEQHFYPKCLLKHFSDDDGLFYEYNLLSQKVTHCNYENVCFHNYTYETDEIDNQLENLFSIIEPKISIIIDSIVNDAKEISDTEIDVLWQYVLLQQIRTDSGRLMWMNYITDNNVPSRKGPVSLKEIREGRGKIKQFNQIHKNPAGFFYLLQYLSYNQNVRMHVGISEQEFITSDNPVVSCYARGNDFPIIMFMPISPCLCIEFIGKDVNPSENQFVKYPVMKARYINQMEIQTANYSVIAYSPFDMVTSSLIVKRINTNNR